MWGVCNEEKLKRLKVDLKVWNKEVFGDVNLYEAEVNKKLQELDEKDNNSELSEPGRIERKSLLANLSSNKFKQEAIAFQKARSKWFKQGDMNTKYFHSVIKWRRSNNGINGLMESDVCYEEPEIIKGKGKSFL